MNRQAPKPENIKDMGNGMWREKTPEEKLLEKLPQESRGGAELFSKIIRKIYE